MGKLLGELFVFLPVLAVSILMFQYKSRNVGVKESSESSRKHFGVANVSDVRQCGILRDSTKVTHVHSLYMEGLLERFTIDRDNDQTIEKVK